MIIKQVNFKDRKKSTNHAKTIRRYSHFTKRYAVTPTAQKDSPLLHKVVDLSSDSDALCVSVLSIHLCFLCEVNMLLSPAFPWHGLITNLSCLACLNWLSKPISIQLNACRRGWHSCHPLFITQACRLFVLDITDSRMLHSFRSGSLQTELVSCSHAHSCFSKWCPITQPNSTLLYPPTCFLHPTSALSIYSRIEGVSQHRHDCA